MKILIKNNWRSITVIFAIIVDMFAIFASSVVAYFVSELIYNFAIYQLNIFQFVMYFGVVLIFFAMIMGLYRATFHSNINRQYLIASKTYVFTVLLIFSFLFIFQYRILVPRRFIFMFFLYIPLFFLVGRFFLNKFNLYMRKKGYGIHNVLLVGYDNDGLSIANRFKIFPELGYEIKCVLTNGKIKQHDAIININGSIVPKLSFIDIEKHLSLYNIDRIFIPSSDTIIHKNKDLLEVCKKKRIKLKILSDDADSLLRLSRVYDIAGITLYTPEQRYIQFTKITLKRLFDIVGSMIALILISPVFLIFSILIILEDGCPVFFTQTRALAKGTKKIKVLKFRSMYRGAEIKQKELYAYNEVDGGLFKMKNDPRVTRIGKIMRKLSIDEVPQFINVLRGDMSLVGPRPLSLDDIANISNRDQMNGFYALRAKGKPGITGLWQISGRRNISFREMVLLDLYYIENQSLLFDLEIIFATIPVVLFGKGAY